MPLVVGLFEQLAVPVIVLLITLLSKRSRLVAWASLAHPTRDDMIIETPDGPKIVPQDKPSKEERDMAGVA